MNNFDDAAYRYGSKAVQNAEKRIDDIISEFMAECSADYFYTVNDLDSAINDDETLREYITDSEDEFGLDNRDLDNMSGEELTAYVQYLDTLWETGND